MKKVSQPEKIRAFQRDEVVKFLTLITMSKTDDFSQLLKEVLSLKMTPAQALEHCFNLHPHFTNSMAKRFVKSHPNPGKIPSLIRKVVFRMWKDYLELSLKEATIE